MIRTLKAASGDVVVVATVPTIEPYGDIREYINKLFENHGKGIGEKGKNNGLLIVLAMKEHRVQMEVGYSLEQWVTDGFVGETSRLHMTPEFKQGRYGDGLRIGTERVIGRIAQGRNITLEGVRVPRDRPSSGGTPIGPDGDRADLPGDPVHQPYRRRGLRSRRRPLGQRRLERLVERRWTVRWRRLWRFRRRRGRRRRVRWRLRWVRRREQRRRGRRLELVTRRQLYNLQLRHDESTRRTALSLVVALAAIPLTGCSYNQFVGQEEAIKAQWAQVENQLQRRNDLIPNLVETVKGYATHEESVYKDIADARSRLLAAKSPEETIQAANQQTAALGRLLAVVESYPQLRANEQFNRLMDELAGTENRIAVERMRYNERVQEYDTARRQFPANLTAKMFGFKEHPFFEAPAEAKQVPKVNFTKPS